jgi:hypothetical protein
MTSETDQPRQRTVAELLAQHGAGDATATGRRRRRRDADDVSDDAAGSGQAAPGAPGQAGQGPGQGGANGATAWPSARSPQAERPAGPPPASLAGPAGAREAGPRPPSALPLQYSPPATDTGGAPTSTQNGTQNGAANGARAGAGPWGQSGRESGPTARTDVHHPEPLRADPAGAPWPGQGRPGAARDRSGPVDAQATAAWSPQFGRTDQGPREQPQRAFPVAPEPTRGGPPHASAPHAGSAPLPASALFGPPPAAPAAGRSPFEPPNQPPYGRPGEDPNLTGPIDHQRLAALTGSEATSRVQAPVRPPIDDSGPATAVGRPPAGAEDWHRSRVGQDRPGADPAVDAGPPTEAAAPMDFDDFDAPEPAGVDARPAGMGPPAGSTARVPGTAPADGAAPADPDAADPDAGGTVQSWGPVLAQWIVGAIGGAALWVGFRYLWSSLLVVAIAAAILVTAGLVVVVRTLLRNSDLRTTIAAVLVGILLTVSPAVLVLLGR